MSKALVIPGSNFSANKITTIQFVESKPCTGLSLEETTKTLTSMTAFTLTAAVTPADTTDAVSWASSNTDVATVADGVVTVVGLGTATITATCGNYSAICTVSVDNVVPSYAAVAGYSPFLRTAMLPSMTTDKKTDSLSGAHVIIAGNQATGLYPIESKDNIDTSPYRFVPIMIPKGATKIIFETALGTGKIKTRMAWIDSSRSAANASYPADSAYCVQGSIGAYDQDSTTQTPLTMNIPDNVSGLDSFCCALAIGGFSGTYYDDYTSSISVKFSYDE